MIYLAAVCLIEAATIVFLVVASTRERRELLHRIQAPERARTLIPRSRPTPPARVISAEDDASMLEAQDKREREALSGDGN